MGSEVEVTAADREKAAEIVEQHDGVPWDLFQEHQWDSVAAIAAALAAERAKARAPFLALAEELDRDAVRSGAGWALAGASRRIRRAAEDPPEVSET